MPDQSFALEPGGTSRPGVAWRIVVGLLVERFDLGFLRGIGAGWPSVFAGLVYGILLDI